MKNFITALASALLVAAIVTSLYIYVFSSEYERAPLALFVLSFLGMAAVALFNVRQSALRSGIATAAPVAAAAPRANARSASAGGGRNRNQARNQNAKSSEAKPAGGRDGRQDRGSRKPAADSGAEATTAKAADSAPKPAAPIPDGPRETGTVKWFNRSKGFGFIIRDDGEEIFVHHRSIRNSDDTRRSNLRDGQVVNYVVADHSKGQQAEDVVGE